MGDPTASCTESASGVSAMADSATSIAETAQNWKVTGGGKTTRRGSRRVAASKKKVTQVRDAPTLRQAMACNHRERWLEAMLDEYLTK